MYKLEMKKTFTDDDRSKINDVISQFFEEFNPKSSIDLKKGFCHIWVLFEEPPKELIKKMMECNPDEFIYVESNTTNIVGKKQSDFDNSDKSEEEAETDSEDSDESEEETETDSEDSDESEEESETDSGDSGESEGNQTDSEDSGESEGNQTDSEDSGESEGEETDSRDSGESEGEETDSGDSGGLEGNQTDSEDSGESEGEETDSKDSDESEDDAKTETKTKVSNKIEETAMPRKKGAKIKECGEIKLLLELAPKSSSYEEFLNSIAKTIEFGKREVIFIKILNAASENQGMSFEKISKLLEISDADKYAIRMRVSNYFSKVEEKVTLGGLINEIVKYKDYSFKTKTDNFEIKADEPTVVPVSADQKVSDSTELKVSNSAEQTVRRNKVPVIPEFEEFLGNINKTLTIKERVEKVINYMAPKLSDRIYEYHVILNYMRVGVSLKAITHDAIVQNDKSIPDEARMYTSRLIRAFIDAKAKSSEPIVTVDFLEYLQKFILTSDELRKL